MSFRVMSHKMTTHVARTSCFSDACEAIWIPRSRKHIEGVVSQDIDWEKVIQTAVDHRVMPLLYQSLHTFCPKAVPKIILHRLQELFRSNATRNLFLVSELLKLLKLLESHGIGAIAFKGPVLAVYAYGNLSLRQQR